MMDASLIAGIGAKRRLAEYLKRAGDVVGNKRRRASFHIYAMGLMSNGERKSAEPIATRACADPALVDAYHQRLTYFLSESEWLDAPVRRFAARYALNEMLRREQVLTWSIDELAFAKQGSHSVGVQRQCTGTFGRIANCQIGVGLSVGTPTERVPIDFELYLPRSWSDDPGRRLKAHLPDEVGYQTKPELAMQMIRRALADQVPAGVVLADTAYGDSSTFRRNLRECGLDFAAAIHAPTTVWRVDESGGRCGQPMSVEDVGHDLRAGLRKVSWSEGSTKLSSRFARCRVRPVSSVDGGTDGAEAWLLVEMPPGETAACKFWLATLSKDTTMEQLVHLVKERHRTAGAFAELKENLGLDHFEGRTYRGWHHHVTVALVCYAFIVAERVSRFFSRERVLEAGRSRLSTCLASLPPLSAPAADLRSHHLGSAAQRSDSSKVQ